MDGTVRFVRTLAVFLFFFSYTLAASYSSTAHLTDDYFVIPIDINADEREDTLLQSLTPERESTVSLGNGSDASTLPLQTLEEIDPDLEWNREHSFLHVGDFNGDGRDDLYLQGRAAGSHQAFVLADPSGRYLSVSEKFSGPHYGFDWSAAVQDVVVGDYDGNGQSELLLRGHDTFDIHLIMRPNRDGILNTTGPSWVDGHLDLPWHTAAAELHPGDFNGDGRTDLVWRSREEGDADPRVAILLASEEGEFTEIAVQGDDDFLDAEWDPATHLILIDDINGDGIDDIVLQARSKTGTNHLVLGDVNGRFEETALSWQGPTSAATAYDQQNSSASINTAGTSTDQKSGDVSMFSMTEPGTGIVGALPGEFSVDPNGASNYRIPIEVPPGVGGMQPDLAFLYSSRAGNGQLGVGWSLSGLSAITRCPKTLAQDDEVGGVQLDGDDRFCLDGQRLMLESGSQYGETGSEYRTEVESFQRITASDESHGSGPESFTVEDKAKLTRYYGKTSNSRILAGGPVLLWAINRIEDPYGNYIAFEYEQDLTAGEYWIKKISWHNADDVTIGEVRFTYSTSRPDTSSGFLPNGDETSLTRRMTQATVYGRAGVHANPGRVRAYQLDYEQGDVTGLSQLTSITQCAHNNSTCLPSTTFEWQQGVDGFDTARTLFSSGSIGSDLVHADLDGDGRPDWIYNRNGYWYVRFARRLSEEVPTNRPARDADKVIVLDIDGNGHQELLATVEQQGESYLGGGLVYTGDGTDHSFDGIAPQFPFESGVLEDSVAVDLDGDGLPELLTHSDFDNKLRYYMNTGGAFSSIGVNTGFELDDSQALIPINFSGSGSGEILVSLGSCENPDPPPGGGGGGDDDPPTQENKSSHVSFQKVDTTADATSHCWDTAGVLHWTGDGLERVTSAGFSRFLRPVPLDVNGDGLTDIAYATGNTASDGWYLYVNTGGRFDWAWSEDNGWGYQSDSARAIDYNNDGLSDLLLPLGNGNWHALLSNGEDLDNRIDTGIPSTGRTTTRVMDMSGDGLADLLYSQDGSWRLRSSRGGKPGLLRQVTNGLGDGQRVHYTSLTTVSGNHQIYLGHSGTPAQGAHHMMGPLQVVRVFSATTGSAVPVYQQWVNTRYRYGGAKMDRRGRGFLGFERIEAHNLNSDIVTVNLHRQDFPYTGMVTKSIQKMPDEVIWESGSTGSTGTGASGGCYDDETGTWILPDGCEPDYFEDFDEPESFETIPGAKVSETINTYGKSELGSSVYPYLKKSVEKHYRHPASTETVYRRVTTDYGDNYDDYGNPLNITVTTDSGSTGGDAHIVHTANVYQNDEPSWCLSRLMNSTVTHTRADYGTGNPAPIQEIRNSRFEYQGCRLSLEEVEPNGAADENLVTTYEYDDFGNTALTTTTAATGNRTTTTVYDALGLFPVRVTNALGHTEQQAWDPRFGKRVSQTGPNGLTTQWEYDAFGRKELERSPRGTETTREYRWCSTTDCERAHAMYAIETERSDGGFSRVEFDTLGREVNKTGIAVVDSVSGIEESIHQATYYDPLGRAYASSQPYFDGDTACWTVRKFDNLGRVTVEASPIGESQCSAAPPAYGASAPSGWSRTDYTYNGLQTTAVVTPDPADLSLQRTTVRTENVAGRLLSVSEAGTSTVYDYDATGNTTWVKAGSNPPTEITYNKRGDKVSMFDPDMGDWSYEYTAFGELKKQTDAVGNVTEMWYDALGRMTKRIDTAAPPDGGSIITEWGYDSGYGAGVGKPAYVVKSDGYLETWAYNDYGQKTDTIKQIDGELFWTSQSYDALGRPDILVYPDVEDFVTDADPTLSNLAITAHEPGRHTVSWDSDADHALYTLYRTRDNDTPDPENDATVVYTGALKSFKDTVHQDGEYRYWVKGCLDDADCDVLGPAAITVTLPPGAPQGVRIEPVVSTDGELDISWNPPINGGSVSSYQVQERYSANGSSWSNWSSTETVADTVTSGAYTKTSSGYYDYRVQACNAVDCSAPVSAYDAARVTLKPPAPGLQVADGLNGNGASPDGQFTLGWNGPPASETVTHYELWEREDSIGSWSRVPGEPLGADREWSPAYDKSDDTLWHYRIRACNDIGCSGDSNTISVQVLYTPGMPGGITLPVNSGDGIYEVSWGEASGSVDKYELWEREGADAENDYSNEVMVYDDSAPVKQFNGKDNGAYFYRVRACNVSGSVSECSAFREALHAIVVLPPPQLSADPPESGGVHELTWTSVPDGTSYRLERQKNAQGWQTPPLYSGTATSFEDSVTLPELYYDDLYQYRVNACLLPAGCGPFSDPRQVSVTNSPKPVITVPSSSTTGDYTVSWTGGSLYNTLEQRKDGGAWVNVPLDYQDATSKTYNDKANGTYEYKVQACNDVNCSNWSDIVSITVLKPPVAPTLTAPDYNNTGDYIVFWDDPDGAETYELYRDAEPEPIYTGTNTSYPETGMPNGTYSYRVKACNASGCSGLSSSDSTTVTLPPPAPSVSAPTADGDGSFTVTWNAGIRNWLQSRVNGGGWTTHTMGENAFKEFSGLDAGTYDFRAKQCSHATNDALCSSYGDIDTTVVVRTPGSLSAPSSDNNGAYTVSWGSVSTATSYRLIRRKNGGSWSTVYNSSGTSKSESGLGNGTYDYRVRACYNSTCTPYTGIDSTVVLHPPATPSLSAPTSASKYQSFTVSWTSETGAATYQLQRNGSTVQNNSSTNYSNSLNAGTYHYRVRACNASGCSGWSATKTTTVQDTGGCSPSQPWNCEDPQSSPTDPVLFEGMDDGNTSTDPGADDGLTYSREYRNREGKTRVAVAAAPAAASSAEPLQSQPGVINAASLKTDSRSTVGNFRAMSPQRPGDFYRSLRIGRAPATSRPVAANDDAAVPTGTAGNNTHDTTGNTASMQSASTERASRARSVKASWSPAPVTPLRPDPRINPDVRSKGNHDNLATQSDTKDTESSFSVQKFGETNEPSGTYAHAVQYHYDARGGLASVSECVDDGGSGCGSGGVVYWQAEVRDAAGSVTQEKLGNGITTARDIHRVTGALRGIDSFAADGTPIQQQTYEWDLAGNLTARQDHLIHGEGGIKQSFDYDGRYRLTYSKTEYNVSYLNDDERYNHYADNGNIRCFNVATTSCSGDYSYHASKPHAVEQVAGISGSYTYNLNGAMETGPNGRNIQWTAFSKPSRIDGNGTYAEFAYDASRSRYRMTTSDGIDTTITTYIGALYERVETGGTTTHRFHIFAGGSAVAVYSCTTDCGKDPDTGTGGDTRDETRYLHRDHLGSITAITSGKLDSNGDVVVLERFHYTAWGEQMTWIEDGTGQGMLQQTESSEQDRGFTGHVMLNDLGLVHMNGRIYDPGIGRFLSADPHVQFPESTQGYNRYTYVGNNPLSYTDPSGYFLKKLLGGALAGDIKQLAPTLIGIAMCAGSAGVGCAVAAGALSGAVGGYMATGTLRGTFRGAAMGAASGAIFGSIAGSDMGLASKALIGGVAGGLLSEAGGGRFGDGFLGGAAGMLTSGIAPTGDLATDTLIGAITGGTVAAIGGGKFVNGAITGAFAAAMGHDRNSSPSQEESGATDDLTSDLDSPSAEHNLRRAKEEFWKMYEDGLLDDVGYDFLEIYSPGDRAVSATYMNIDVDGKYALMDIDNLTGAKFFRGSADTFLSALDSYAHELYHLETTNMRQWRTWRTSKNPEFKILAQDAAVSHAEKVVNIWRSRYCNEYSC